MFLTHVNYYAWHIVKSIEVLALFVLRLSKQRDKDVMNKSIPCNTGRYYNVP